MVVLKFPISPLIDTTNKVLSDCIREITILFLDNIVIKGYVEGQDGMHTICLTYKGDRKKVLRTVDDAHLISSTISLHLGNQIFLCLDTYGDFMVTNLHEQR